MILIQNFAENIINKYNVLPVGSRGSGLSLVHRNILVPGIQNETAPWQQFVFNLRIVWPGLTRRVIKTLSTRNTLQLRSWDERYSFESYPQYPGSAVSLTEMRTLLLNGGASYPSETPMPPGAFGFVGHQAGVPGDLIVDSFYNYVPSVQRNLHSRFGALSKPVSRTLGRPPTASAVVLSSRTAFIYRQGLRKSPSPGPMGRVKLRALQPEATYSAGTAAFPVQRNAYLAAQKKQLSSPGLVLHSELAIKRSLTRYVVKLSREQLKTLTGGNKKPTVRINSWGKPESKQERPSVNRPVYHPGTYSSKPVSNVLPMPLKTVLPEVPYRRGQHLIETTKMLSAATQRPWHHPPASEKVRTLSRLKTNDPGWIHPLLHYVLKTAKSTGTSPGKLPSPGPMGRVKLQALPPEATYSAGTAAFQVQRNAYLAAQKKHIPGLVLHSELAIKRSLTRYVVKSSREQLKTLTGGSKNIIKEIKPGTSGKQQGTGKLTARINSWGKPESKQERPSVDRPVYHPGTLSSRPVSNVLPMPLKTVLPEVPYRRGQHLIETTKMLSAATRRPWHHPPASEKVRTLFRQKTNDPGWIHPLLHYVLKTAKSTGTSPGKLPSPGPKHISSPGLVLHSELTIKRSLTRYVVKSSREQLKTLAGVNKNIIKETKPGTSGKQQGTVKLTVRIKSWGEPEFKQERPFVDRPVNHPGTLSSKSVSNVLPMPLKTVLPEGPYRRGQHLIETTKMLSAATQRPWHRPPAGEKVRTLFRQKTNDPGWIHPLLHYVLKTAKSTGTRPGKLPSPGPKHISSPGLVLHSELTIKRSLTRYVVKSSREQLKTLAGVNKKPTARIKSWGEPESKQERPFVDRPVNHPGTLSSKPVSNVLPMPLKTVVPEGPYRRGQHLIETTKMLSAATQRPWHRPPAGEKVRTLFRQKTNDPGWIHPMLHYVLKTAKSTGTSPGKLPSPGPKHISSPGLVLHSELAIKRSLTRYVVKSSREQLKTLTGGSKNIIKEIKPGTSGKQQGTGKLTARINSWGKPESKQERPSVDRPVYHPGTLSSRPVSNVLPMPLKTVLPEVPYRRGQHLIETTKMLSAATQRLWHHPPAGEKVRTLFRQKTNDPGWIHPMLHYVLKTAKSTGTSPGKLPSPGPKHISSPGLVLHSELAIKRSLTRYVVKSSREQLKTLAGGSKNIIRETKPDTSGKQQGTVKPIARIKSWGEPGGVYNRQVVTGGKGAAINMLGTDFRAEPRSLSIIQYRRSKKETGEKVVVPLLKELSRYIMGRSLTETGTTGYRPGKQILSLVGTGTETMRSHLLKQDLVIRLPQSQAAKIRESDEQHPGVQSSLSSPRMDLFNRKTVSESPAAKTTPAARPVEVAFNADKGTITNSNIPPAEIKKITEKVYIELEKKLKHERQRRGL
ncbi:MAG: hypothetical protein FH756_17945 [Firmicutes bacterium]|nr:hypothetical protein [Bacillota bacterium]